MTQNWRGIGGEWPEGVRYPEWDSLRITYQNTSSPRKAILTNRLVTIELADDEPYERPQAPSDHGVDVTLF